MKVNYREEGYQILISSGCISTQWQVILITISLDGMVTRITLELVYYMEFLPTCWAAVDNCAASFGPAMLAFTIRFNHKLNEKIGRVARRATAQKIYESMPRMRELGKLNFVSRFVGKSPTHEVNYVVESEEEVEQWKKEKQSNTNIHERTSQY